MLIDTHAHLIDEHYKENLDEMISKFEENKLEKVFTVAYSKQTIVDSINLAEKHKNVYAVIGIHPDEVDDFDNETIELLEKYSTHPKVIGIGEIGLDYHYDNFDKARQKKVFIEQLKLAHKVGLPVAIHNRDSIGDCMEILKNHRDLLSNGGVIHCYSESVEIYKEIKKLGLKISFGGILTFKNSVVAPEVCKIAEIEDILIETDCPYLTPHPYRGQINEPKYVSLVAQKIAEIKGLSYDKVVEITTNNALTLFKKAK